MGCFSSKIDNISVVVHETCFSLLGLTKSHLKKLTSVFKRIDLDDSGSIDIQEMMVKLKLEITPFSKRIFRVLDSNGSGQLDFFEFTVSLWNFCTLARTSFGKHNIFITIINLMIYL